MNSERRRHSRYPVRIELIARELGSLEYTDDDVNSSFRAVAENISAWGLCLVAPQRIPESSIVCCKVSVPGIPAAIPVLMKVQWVRKAEDRKFRVGLKHLVLLPPNHFGLVHSES